MQKQFLFLILLVLVGSSLQQVGGQSTNTLTNSKDPKSPASVATKPDPKAKEFFEQGLEQLDAGQLSEAAESFQQAIRLQPDYAAAYSALGRTYFRQRQWEKSVESFRKATELSSKQRANERALQSKLLTQKQELVSAPAQAVTSTEKLKQPEPLSPNFTGTAVRPKQAQTVQPPPQSTKQISLAIVTPPPRTRPRTTNENPTGIKVPTPQFAATQQPQSSQNTNTLNNGNAGLQLKPPVPNGNPSGVKLGTPLTGATQQTQAPANTAGNTSTGAQLTAPAPNANPTSAKVTTPQTGATQQTQAPANTAGNTSTGAQLTAPAPNANPTSAKVTTPQTGATQQTQAPANTAGNTSTGAQLTAPAPNANPTSAKVTTPQTGATQQTQAPANTAGNTSTGAQLTAPAPNANPTSAKVTTPQTGATQQTQAPANTAGNTSTGAQLTAPAPNANPTSAKVTTPNTGATQQTQAPANAAGNTSTGAQLTAPARNANPTSAKVTTLNTGATQQTQSSANTAGNTNTDQQLKPSQGTNSEVALAKALRSPAKTEGEPQNVALSNSTQIKLPQEVGSSVTNEKPLSSKPDALQQLDQASISNHPTKAAEKDQAIVAGLEVVKSESQSGADPKQLAQSNASEKSPTVGDALAPPINNIAVKPEPRQPEGNSGSVTSTPVNEQVALEQKPTGIRGAMSVTPLSTTVEAKPISPSTTAVPSNEALLTKIYRVGPGDVLDIRISDSQTPQSTLFTITASGLLEHPMLPEPLLVTGFTAEEIGTKLESELVRRSLLDNAHVAVGVREYASHTILVSGLVRDSGTRFLRREAIPLYVVVADAQPLPEAARVTVVRNEKNELYELDLAQAADMNLLVQPGDVVTLLPNVTQFIYIGGEVKLPGEKTFRRGLTLTQSIILSGGVTPKSKVAEIARDDGQGFLVPTRFSLEEIRSGKLADPLIRPGDRIMILR